VGTKPTIPEGPRKKTHGARPSAAIPGNAKELVDFLFSAAIPDALKKKKYLKRRPKTEFRQVFLRSRAPIQPLSNVSSLNSIIGVRMKEAGIEVDGMVHTPSASPVH
jgi:hypothetical protein